MVVAGRCTSAVQKRCSYSAQLVPKRDRVLALYRRCTKALFVQRPFVPSWDSVLALYRRCSQALYVQRPWRNQVGVLHFFQVRRCTYRSTYSDLYSAQGIIFVTFQNDVTLSKLSIYMADCLWLVFNTQKSDFESSNFSSHLRYHILHSLISLMQNPLYMHV